MKTLSRTSTISAPGTPTGQRKDSEGMQMLQKSPGSQSTISKMSSPSQSSSDINPKHGSSTSSESSSRSQTSAERMHHNIPHRMQSALNMRPSKCPVCLISAHFGKQISKCSECAIICHTKCAPSLPNTCGLPSKLASHFNNSTKENRVSSAERDSAFDSASGDVRMSGWLKIPRKYVLFHEYFINMNFTVLSLEPGLIIVTRLVPMRIGTNNTDTMSHREHIDLFVIKLSTVSKSLHHSMQS